MIKKKEKTKQKQNVLDLCEVFLRGYYLVS